MQFIKNLFASESCDDVHDDITLGIAESVTAGAVANIMCAEPGASKFMRGATVAYSIQSKKDLLGVNIEYAEKNNFANPFTTEEMARAAATIYKARIGIATTGYSLPLYRPADESLGYCELNILYPYGYICLYDRVEKYAITKKMVFSNNSDISPALLRAQVQTDMAIACKQLYLDHIKKIQNKQCAADTIVIAQD